MLENEKLNPNVNEKSRKDLFKLAKRDDTIHDTKFETKPVTYLQDCFRRFVKNKASVTAAIILMLIGLFSIFEPMLDPKNHFSEEDFVNGEMKDANFDCVTPKNIIFEGTGFWDGTKVETLDNNTYAFAKQNDSNYDMIVEEIDSYLPEGLPNSPVYADARIYEVRVDTYAVGCQNLSLKKEQFEALVKHEKEKGWFEQKDKGSIMKPLVDYELYLSELQAQLISEGFESISERIIGQLRTKYINNPSYYFKIAPAKTETGYNDNKIVLVDENNDGKADDIYKRDENGNLVYYEETNGTYNVRVDYYDYFTYRYGVEPIFLFGSNKQGQDILLRLALGVRFSLMLGICITLINFIIGLIWGAISGYYGGKADLIMERFTDIIANIPSIIIMSIANIQLVGNEQLKAVLGSAGTVVVAIFIAFIYNGWVGVAGTTRMQFYRFKGQEYVLASRTLGAKDRRLIFKHILPNATGSLVTRSILMVPSIIFSEASLSYLGIINFENSGICSIGAMLNEGKSAGLQANPHVLLFPSLLITLLMISFNLFGNGLRDAFNTTLRGSED